MLNNKKRQIISVLISLSLIIFLFKQINLLQAKEILGRFSWSWALGGLLTYLGLNILRAWRWRILIHSKKIKFKDIFKVTVLHNFFGNLLPARSGELTYLYFLKKYHQISFSESGATLLFGRIFDVVGIVVLFLFSFILQKPILFTTNKLAQGSFLVLICLILLLVFLAPLSRFFLRRIEWLFSIINIKEKKLTQRILIGLKKAVQNFELINQRRIHLTIFPLSLGIWLTKFLTIAFILNGFQVELPFWQVILGAGLVQLFNILPIQGLAGFGTNETIWTAVFVSLGLDKDLAIISAFGVHLFILFYASLLVLLTFNNSLFSHRKNFSKDFLKDKNSYN